MTTLLLGATGRTGKHVLMELLQEGHAVNVIIRDRKKITTQLDDVKIFEGEITNPNILNEALLNCDYIVSILNVSRKSDFPWSKLRTPKTFLSDTMLFVLKAANPNIIKKIIICSAWGTNETKSEIPYWFRWLIENSNIGPAYEDHERQEDLLKKSKFNFTIVRPVGLTNSSRNQIIMETQNYNPNLKLTISRKSVAKFIVRQISNNLYQRQSVTISKK